PRQCLAPDGARGRPRRREGHPDHPAEGREGRDADRGPGLLSHQRPLARRLPAAARPAPAPTCRDDQGAALQPPPGRGPAGPGPNAGADPTGPAAPLFVAAATPRGVLGPGAAPLRPPGAGAPPPRLARLTAFARERGIPVIATACAHTPDEDDPEPFPLHC